MTKYSQDKMTAMSNGNDVKGQRTTKGQPCRMMTMPKEMATRTFDKMSKDNYVKGKPWNLRYF